MKFFDGILGKAGNIADYAVKKGGEVTSTAKVHMQMHTIKAQLAKVYENLGRAYYDNAVNGEDNNADIADYMHEIRGLEADLADCEAELADIQGYVICPKCGESVDNTCNFCPKCGKKFNVSAEEPEEEDEEEEEEQSEDEEDEEETETEDEEEEEEEQSEEPANEDGTPKA